MLALSGTVLLLCAWFTEHASRSQPSTTPWPLRQQTRRQHHTTAAAAAPVTASGTGADHRTAPERYAVLIDAGSSGSRIHVYTYYLDDGGAESTAALQRRHRYGYGSRYGYGGHHRQLPYYPEVVLPGRILRVTPGLSEFAPAGEGVEESLNSLVKFAQEQVPPSLHASTPIRLMATAGLRLLPPDQREAVLGAARRVLAASGFAFRPDWVRVISGDEEGLFAWAGINYAAGRLQALARERATSPRRRDPAAMAGRAVGSTVAVLELGGASMQLTLMPWEPLPREREYRLALPGVDRPLYTHSFLGYGLQVAWFREGMLVQQGGENATDPCLNPGYMSYESGIAGGGSFAECARLASQLIAAADMSQQQHLAAAGGGGRTAGGTTAGCGYARCSIGGEYLPVLAPEVVQAAEGAHNYVIMATESFHYTLYRLGLPPNASLEALKEAGSLFCARPWSDVERELVLEGGVNEEYALKVCFGAAYIYTLLREGFNMGPREASYLRFTNSVMRPDGSQVEVNWVLGALLLEVASVDISAVQSVVPSTTATHHRGSESDQNAHAVDLGLRPGGVGVQDVALQPSTAASSATAGAASDVDVDGMASAFAAADADNMSGAAAAVAVEPGTGTSAGGGAASSQAASLMSSSGMQLPTRAKAKAKLVGGFGVAVKAKATARKPRPPPRPPRPQPVLPARTASYGGVDVGAAAAAAAAEGAETRWSLLATRGVAADGSHRRALTAATTTTSATTAPIAAPTGVSCETSDQRCTASVRHLATEAADTSGGGERVANVPYDQSQNDNDGDHISMDGGRCARDVRQLLFVMSVGCVLLVAAVAAAAAATAAAPGLTARHLGGLAFPCPGGGGGYCWGEPWDHHRRSSTQRQSSPAVTLGVLPDVSRGSTVHIITARRPTPSAVRCAAAADVMEAAAEAPAVAEQAAAATPGREWAAVGELQALGARGAAAAAAAEAVRGPGGAVAAVAAVAADALAPRITVSVQRLALTDRAWEVGQGRAPPATALAVAARAALAVPAARGAVAAARAATAASGQAPAVADMRHASTAGMEVAASPNKACASFAGGDESGGDWERTDVAADLWAGPLGSSRLGAPVRVTIPALWWWGLGGAGRLS